MLCPFVEGGLLIHGDDDGLAPGPLHAVEQRAALVEAAPRIELEPRRSARGGGNLLRRLAGVVADDEGCLRGGRCLVHAHFAVGMKRHLQRRGGHQQGEVEAQPEHRRARVDGGGVNRRARDDVDPPEGIAIAADRGLRIGAVRGVVVDGLRDVAVEDRLEVEDRGHLGQPRNAPMVAELPRVALGRDQRRPGDECRQADERVAPARTLPPAPFDRPHGCLPSGQTWSGSPGARRSTPAGRRYAAATPKSTRGPTGVPWEDGRAKMREIFGEPGTAGRRSGPAGRSTESIP